MIRRSAGNDFLLITQTDHAALAGELAARFGNDRFARPADPENLLTAVRLHDEGWPLHDDAPTLNSRGLPLDVLETPHAVDLMVWGASADRAEAVDPYAGLLVSLHSLSLSVLASGTPVHQDKHFDLRKMQDQFAINKFQHREVERQEQLRSKLGIPVNLPLKHGLAELRASAIEDRVLFDFRLLQAMDLISLFLCCSNPPQDHTNDVMTAIGGNAVQLKLRKKSESDVRVTPWPFDVPRLELSVDCRRVSGKPFDSVESFRAAYAGTSIERTDFILHE